MKKHGAGLIKNIFLPFFMCCCLHLFSLSICHADAVPPQVCYLDNCVTVELVSKPEDMQRGLMYRDSLGKDKGMMFVFAYDDNQSFWMKNMRFNLDMVWISHEGRIVFISHDVPVCKEDPCPVYTPDQACRYVLELNSGYTALHDWKVGDKLHFLGL